MGRTNVDIAAVRVAAQRFDTAAEILDGALRTQLSRLRFDGAIAGRAHTASGDAVHRALEQLIAEVAQWSRAAGEIAASVRAGADRYVEAELHAAAGIR